MAESSSSSLSSIRTVFIVFSLVCTVSLSFLLILNKPASTTTVTPHFNLQDADVSIKVFVFDLPRSFNYGLIEKFWSLIPNSKPPSDPNDPSGSIINPDFPPLPQNLAIEQHSTEYWMLGDLMTPEEQRNGSFAKRVFDVKEADVVLVPFFSSVSSGMQVGLNKNVFTQKVENNEDYMRQKEVVDLVINSEAWKRSGGRDHVFVVADPMAMLHVKEEIAPAILLVVDFGAWYLFDSKASDGSSPEWIKHTQVSLLKDVIVPYNYLLPTLPLSEDKLRHNLLYFRGGRYRNKGGKIRAVLWDVLVDEPGVVMEEGSASVVGRKQAIIGMRSSEFCLDPAGDTPASCRLFDAIQSLCIPVIVSDQIELPFEGMIDYLELAVFVSAENALKPKWLTTYLQSITKKQIDEYRINLARVQPMFVYDNGYPGGIGPYPVDGAVNQIWRKIHQKLPMIKEAVIRGRRKPPGVTIPLRCQCT